VIFNFVRKFFRRDAIPTGHLLPLPLGIAGLVRGDMSQVFREEVDFFFSTWDAGFSVAPLFYTFVAITLFQVFGIFLFIALFVLLDAPLFLPLKIPLL